MANINICRDNKDPFYRYKMPPIVSKIEGRGNGIKTAVVNTSDVARALSRPPSYIVKWFGFELGAQTSINEASDRFIVNGAHDAPKLQDLLDGFINRYVLCGSCKNPETDILLLKDGNLTRDCKACGQRTLIDPRHKLTSFVLKNPPATAKGGKKKAMANAGASTSAADLDNGTGSDDSKPKSKANGSGAGAEEDGGSDDELTRRIQAEAEALPSLDDNEEKEETWATDVSEEAVRARQRELEKTMALLEVADEDDDEDTAAYNEFGEWIEAEEPSDVDIYKKMVELGIVKKHRAVQVLAQALFTDDIVAELPEHEGLLKKLTSESTNHEKALLGGIERLVGVQYPDKIKEVPNILFRLYNSDIVSEEVIEKWGSRASKKYVDKETSRKVRKAAKPFLEWLAEAESESEEEDDE